MKVLIAEDDPHTRAGLSEILEAEGYQVLTAPDGKDAMRVFQRESPDFVCLDIMMPGMSGYDVCREIRRTNSNVPVIFISAKSEEIDTVIGLELGRRFRYPTGVSPGGSRCVPLRTASSAWRDRDRAKPARYQDPCAPSRKQGCGDHPRHVLQQMLGIGPCAQQPDAGSTHRPVTQAHRDGREESCDHPDGPRRGLPLRRLRHVQTQQKQPPSNKTNRGCALRAYPQLPSFHAFGERIRKGAV